MDVSSLVDALLVSSLTIAVLVHLDEKLEDKAFAKMRLEYRIKQETVNQDAPMAKRIADMIALESFKPVDPAEYRARFQRMDNALAVRLKAASAKRLTPEPNESLDEQDAGVALQVATA
jgi:hypothetical protein